MRAWHVEAPGPVTGHPLRLHTEDEIPRPGPGELLLQVLACGVCRTDLHVTEGVLTRGEQAKRPARELGAASVGDADGTPLAVTAHPYPLDAADQAVRDLKAGRFDGAAVLV